MPCILLLPEHKLIEKVSGRVLVDYFGYQKHFKGLQRADNNTRRTRRGQPESANADEAKYVQTLSKEKQEQNKMFMLGERRDELVYVSPLLEGFALKNKQWRKLSISENVKGWN